MRTHTKQQSKPPAGVALDSTERDDGHGAKAMIGLTVCVVVLSAGALAVLGYDSPRRWVSENVGLALVGSELIALVTVLAAVTIWSRNCGRTQRAVALALIACPTALIGLGTAWALLPPAGAAIAIRCVVVIVFSVTPAIMWWLFLASQRASLLNEFLANLERLGLLEQRKRYQESESSRHTRIASYLQRFEGTYGRLNPEVHRVVIAGNYKHYSNDDVPTLRPTSTAAVPVFLATVVFAVGWLLAVPPVYRLNGDAFNGLMRSSRRSDRSPSHFSARTSSPSRCCSVATSVPTPRQHIRRDRDSGLHSRSSASGRSAALSTRCRRTPTSPSPNPSCACSVS